jgi:hypothetical protein
MNLNLENFWLKIFALAKRARNADAPGLVITANAATTE